ncbi:MAG: thiosulfate oxidation carrier protein SoxY [Burkholderiales bacterium]
MPTRRRFLFGLSALAGLSAASRAGLACAEEREVLVRSITGGAPLRMGRVRLDTPELADNGHAVPLRVIVDSPMTPDNHVRKVVLLAERNPRPIVATFTLGPRAGRAEIFTRIRLADSQEVLALAQFSDGSYWAGGAKVIVTELACLDGS